MLTLAIHAVWVAPTRSVNVQKRLAREQALEQQVEREIAAKAQSAMSEVRVYVCVCVATSARACRWVGDCTYNMVTDLVGNGYTCTECCPPRCAPNRR